MVKKMRATREYYVLHADSFISRSSYSDLYDCDDRDLVAVDEASESIATACLIDELLRTCASSLYDRTDITDVYYDLEAQTLTVRRNRQAECKELNRVGGKKIAMLIARELWAAGAVEFRQALPVLKELVMPARK